MFLKLTERDTNSDADNFTPNRTDCSISDHKLTLSLVCVCACYDAQAHITNACMTSGERDNQWIEHKHIGRARVRAREQHSPHVLVFAAVQIRSGSRPVERTDWGYRSRLRSHRSDVWHHLRWSLSSAISSLGSVYPAHLQHPLDSNCWVCSANACVTETWFSILPQQPLQLWGRRW